MESVPVSHALNYSCACLLLACITLQLYVVSSELQWNHSNAGPTRRVRNIEASVLRKVLVVLLVGVVISIRQVMTRFMALATRWLALACCEGLARG